MKTTKNKTLSDIEVIKAYLSTRDQRYFQMLYRRYSTKVYSRCISILKDEGIAQDAMQEIFLKIFLNLAKFGERAKFSTWVYSITYNYCIDVVRKKKKKNAIFSSDFELASELVADEVHDHTLLEMEVSRLKQVLEELPVGDKVVLLMKYQDDMQIKQIAQSFDKSESAIKMKLKRAKEKAVKIYKNKYKESA